MLGGTEEDFHKLMNVYADKLGMTNTNLQFIWWPK